MKEITADKNLIAYCGLYCGACPRYLDEKCSGCRKNEKLGWCKIRGCNAAEGYHSCADCTLKAYEDCKLNHGMISKFFAFIFNSNRAACVEAIKNAGPEKFAADMAALGSHTIKR